MKLRGILTSLMVVVLLSGFSTPLAGARQRDTSLSRAPAQPGPVTPRVGDQSYDATSDEFLEQDVLYNKWKEGKGSNEKYDRPALVEGSEPGIARPGAVSTIFWESIDDISSSGRARPAAAAVNGKIYLFGGEIFSGYENTVEMFDPTAGVWVDMAGLMPKAASNICAAAIGIDVYIPGGYGDPGVAFTNLQVYHVATDTWETITTDPVPVTASGRACAVMDDKLYTYGGSTGSVYLKSAYVYDPAAAEGSRWTALPDMTYARAWLAGVAINDLVYAVGGVSSPITDLNYVEAFNPGDGSWHTVTNMNTARGGPGAMFQGDTLIVCGGGWSTYLDTCESYDTTQGYAGTWETMSQTMITGRRTFGYASLPETLYTVAGYGANYLTSAERSVQGSRIFLPVVLR